MIWTLYALLFAVLIILAVVVFKITDQRVRDGKTDIDRRLNSDPGFIASDWNGRGPPSAWRGR